MNEKEEKEYWRKLQEEYSPHEYRDYVLCDPIPIENQVECCCSDYNKNWKKTVK